MVISGPATNMIRSPSKAQWRPNWKVPARRLALFVVVAGLLTLSGCSTNISFGSMPRVENLQTLAIGTSKASDVVRALGEPRGHGQAKFRPDLPEQQIWQYEYIETDGTKMHTKMLLVFMNEDTYVGHMWFSSGALVGKTK